MSYRTGRKIFTNTQFLGIKANRSIILYTVKQQGKQNMCKSCALITLPILNKENLTLGRFTYYTVNVHKKLYTILPNSIHKRNNVVLRG